MGHIFISYSSDDRTIAMRIAEELKSSGFEVWIDQWKITGRKAFWDEIQEALESCSHFIFLISNSSINATSGARKELYHAASLRPIPLIIPVMVSQIPLRSLPMIISPGEYQIHDFITTPFEEALQRLYFTLSREKTDTDTGESPAAPGDAQPLSIPKLLVPHNLPSRGIFLGRQEEVNCLIEQIVSDARLIVIEGVGGIGKSSLALEVLHRLMQQATLAFTAGTPSDNAFRVFVWISAKDSPVSFDSLLDTIARTLDYSYIPQLETNQKAEAVTRLLRSMKILLTVDNFETVDDARVKQFVQSVPEPSKVCITTRYHDLSRVDSTQYVTKLRAEEGIGLILDEAKRYNLTPLSQADPRYLEELYETTGGSPLAIKWAIGRIRQRGQTLTSVLRSLRAAHGDLFENMFAGTWALLDENARLVLMSTPLFGAPISREALRSAADLDEFAFDEALSQLIGFSLLESNWEILEANQRFNTHLLTQSFAKRELTTFGDLQELMYERIAFHFLEFCRQSQREPDGFDIIETEIPNILSALTWLENKCNSDDMPPHLLQAAVDFSDAINVFFWSRGYWGERIRLCKFAMHASEKLEDWPAAGKQACFMGIVRFWQGNLSEAKQLAEQALTCANRSSNEVVDALARRVLGLVAMGEGNHELANTILEDVLAYLSNSDLTHHDIDIFADWICLDPKGYRTGEVALLQELGINSNRQRKYDRAIEWLRKSEKLALEINDTEGLSISYSHLGHALLETAELAQAEDAYLKGLQFATQVKRKSTLGRCNEGLSLVASLTGNKKKSLQYGEEAIDLFNRLGMQDEMNRLRQHLEAIEIEE